jgi:hypothetical protein
MTFELAPLFQAVGAALRQNQAALNQADILNGNHGDHMVEIFDLAARAAQEYDQLGMSQAMLHASQLLEQTEGNGSAQVYARGLACLADQFQRQEIELPDLVFFIQKSLAEDKDAQNESQKSTAASSGKTLKTLLTGLAAWSQSESGQPVSERPLDMGALFEFGMAYIQAKQRGGSRVEVLSDAAASVSPLGSVPHRYQSGKLAIQALLQAIQQAGSMPESGSA